MFKYGFSKILSQSILQTSFQPFVTCLKTQPFNVQQYKCANSVKYIYELVGERVYLYANRGSCYRGMDVWKKHVAPSEKGSTDRTTKNWHLQEMLLESLGKIRFCTIANREREKEKDCLNISMVSSKCKFIKSMKCLVLN